MLAAKLTPSTTNTYEWPPPKKWTKDSVSVSTEPWFHQSQAGDFVFKCFGCLCDRAFGLEVWFARFDGGFPSHPFRNTQRSDAYLGDNLFRLTQFRLNLALVYWVSCEYSWRMSSSSRAQIWEIIMETRCKKHLPAQRRRIYLLLSAVPILLACMGYFFLEEIGPLNATTTMNDHNMHMMHMR